MRTEWRINISPLVYELYADNVMVAWIEQRPAYCDRGHWKMECNLPGIDDTDRFPRYFMSLERAKAEAQEFIHWRMHKDSARQESRANVV